MSTLEERLEQARQEIEGFNRLQMMDLRPRDEALETTDLARKFNVDPQLIELDKEGYRERARAQRIEEVFNANPRLKTWLEGDKRRMEITQGDLGPLSKVDRALSDLGMPAIFQEIAEPLREIKHDVSVGWQAGKITDELGFLGYRKMYDAITPEEDRRIAELNKKIMELRGSGGFTENAAKLLGQLTEGLPAHFTAGAAAAATAGIIGQLGPQVAAPEEIITMPSAFAAGMNASIFYRSYRIEAGHAYLDMIKAGVDEDTAFWSANVVGIANGALEVVGFKAVSKPFKDQFAKWFTSEVTKTFVKATRGKALGEAFKSYGKAWGTEVGTELLQEIVQITGEEIAKQITPAELESLLSSEAGRDQLYERLKGVLNDVGKGMALLAIPGASVSYVSARGQVTKAKRAEKKILELGNAIKETQLKKDAPQDFKEFVEDLGPVEDVYINAEEFAEYFQSKGIDPKQAIEEIPSVKEQFEEAINTNGDLRIPLSEYASVIAGTEHQEGLARITKLDPNDLSAIEAERTDLKEQEQFLQAAERLHGENISIKKSANKVFQSIRDQIIKTEKFGPDVASQYAELHRAFAITMGKRLDISPEAVYQKYGLKIAPAPKAEPSIPPSGEAPEAGALYQMKYPMAKRNEWYGDADYKERGGVLVSMAPDAYLRQFRPLKMDEMTRENVDDLKQHILSGKELDPLAIYEDGREDGRHRALAAKELGITEIPVLDFRDHPKVSKAEEYFQEKRGTIRFTPGKSIITLFEDADLSTIFHESGHFFFETMTDMAKTNKTIAKDVQTLLDWFGVKDLKTWEGMSLEQRREHHEKFARGFEAYLFEGKAPSIELQGTFQLFRSWLVSVYRSIRKLNVKLTDEVREVMDRMLASEEQIETARETAEHIKLFESIEQANMSEEAWRQYLHSDELSRQKAIEEHTTKSLKDMKWMRSAFSRELKKLQRTAVSARREMKAEVSEEIKNKPVYQAMRFLKTGEMSTPEEEVKVAVGHKMDSNVLKEMYPPTGLDSVDWKSLSGMYSSTKGVDPDILAGIFGYRDGDQMVRELVAAPSLSKAIEARTDERMLEAYGDMFTDEQMEQSASLAIRNNIRARVLATEITALNKRIGKKKPMISAAKKFAADRITTRIVKDLKPAQYQAAERKAGRAAQKAFGKADTTQAAAHKRSELLNMYLYKAAAEAKMEALDILKYLRKFKKKSTRMRGETIEQIDNLIARFGVSKKTHEQRTPLATFLEEETERLSAMMPEIDFEFLDETFQKHYSELTMGQLRSLRDAVKQLEFLGRREHKMFIEQRDMTFQQEEKALLDELESIRPEVFENGEPKPFKKGIKPLLPEYWDRFKDKFDAEMISMENIFDTITVGRGREIFRSLFIRMSNAQDKQAKMMRELAKFIEKETKAYSRKERITFSKSRVFIPEIGEYKTRDERISVALFYGNKEGQQRLRDGNGYSDAQIKAILDTLTEKDINLVKKIWEMNDTKIWPQLKAVNERTRGIAPKKVETIPYETKFGMLSGGYVPLVYDGDLTVRAYELQQEEAMKNSRGGNPWHAATKQTASKQRVEKNDKPLNLSIGAIMYKVNETVHDITHREAVNDVYRLLKSEKFATAIKNIAGPNTYHAIIEKVREVAMPPIAPQGSFESKMQKFRKNMLINIMGASVQTFLVNVLGAFPSMVRVGPTMFLKHLSKFTGSPRKSWKYVLSKSPYMVERVRGFDRDLNAELNVLSGKSGVLPDMAFWFSGLALMDRLVTIPTWMAAYEQGMQEYNNNEKDAVEYADRIVRQTQGGGRALDLARVSGGGKGAELKKVFTMFYNFFSAQLGMLVRQQRISAKDWSEGKRAKAAMQLTLTVFGVVVLPAFLEAWFKGQCGKEGEEDYLYCAEQKSAFFVSSMFPIARDIIPYTWKQFDPETKAFSVRLSPIESGLESLSKAPKASYDVIFGESDEKDMKTILQSLGFGFGLPGYQAARTMEGYQKLMDGESDNWSDLLFGPKKG